MPSRKKMRDVQMPFSIWSQSPEILKGFNNVVSHARTYWIIIAYNSRIKVIRKNGLF